MQPYTKQALAQALKAMLQTRPLDKITVKELVEHCGVNRQTFYYHFQDIYDLLGWIYRTEALQAIQNNRSYETWQQGLLLILRYVASNQALCMNTYRSLGREHLEAFLDEVLSGLLGSVVDELSTDRTIAKENRDFITRFYSYAFAGVLLDWIKAGLKTPCETLVCEISGVMDGVIVSAVERFSK